MTSKGWTDNVHIKDGNTGFLVGVGVVPAFRQKTFKNNLVAEPQRISRLLLIQTFKKLYQKGVKHVVACARIPMYSKKSELSVEEYCSFRRKDKKLFDPVLRFHKGLTGKTIKAIAYALDDAESLNGGCWVKYDLDVVFSTPPWNKIEL